MNILLAPDPLRPGHTRLRAAWRIAGQLGLLIAFALLLSIPLGILPLLGISLGANFPFLASQAIGFVAITASVFIARRLLDRRSIRSLGLDLDRRAGGELLAGILIAGAMMAAIFLIEWLAGWIAPEGFAWQEPGASPFEQLGYTLTLLVVFIAVGWQEELFARGYLLQNLKDGLNIPWAVVISSSVFALGHLGNPNVSPVAILGLVLAGLFFAFAYLRTRRLWLPIGLHIGWNFFEGPVFGFPVSGLGMRGLIAHRALDAPLLFTGGEFGPEAGLVLLPALALGAGLLWWWTRKTDRIPAES